MIIDKSHTTVTTSIGINRVTGLSFFAPGHRVTSMHVGLVCYPALLPRDAKQSGIVMSQYA